VAVNLYMIIPKSWVLLLRIIDFRMNSLTKPIIKVVPMLPEHWSKVAEIYSQGLATGNASFETKCPEWTAWDNAHRKDCRFIAVTQDRIAGWAALSPVSGRCVYAGVAEVSVYVHSEFRALGIGDMLLKSLIENSEKVSI
jgi:L-amino acid N-acyltransferase YncA